MTPKRTKARKPPVRHEWDEMGPGVWVCLMCGATKEITSGSEDCDSAESQEKGSK